jgi:tetratricopeptide (TPR) repeat protein
LSVFLLALCKIEDTDTWMHLSFGKLIWHLQGLPAKEPFVYTSYDQPFSYSSWLFGLIYYLSYLAFNYYGVILLKALTVTTALFILLRDSLRPYRNYVISIVVMTVVVSMVRHRFVERPDTFLMVFLSFSIFSLNAFVFDNKKYIYALPLVHMLWANTHSSINLMCVPFLSFIAGGVLQHSIGKRRAIFSNTPSPSQVKTILLIFVTSFAASLINPYFISQYSFGAQFLASPWFKQEILELKSTSWEITRWPHFMTAFVLVSFILNRKRFSLIHFFMIVPFIILSFIAIRFVFLLGVVSSPIISRNLSSFVDSKSWDRFLYTKSAAALVALWLIIFPVLELNKVFFFANDRKTFGFGVNYSAIPEDALAFMDKNGITGRVFNIYQWGGYINWRDFPKRSVFVDPRGYIPVELLEKMNLARHRPYMMDELEAKFGFEAILLNYPLVLADIATPDNALFHPQWALVYWDDVSLLYLKRGGRYDSIIRKNEYRFIKPANGITRAKMNDETYRTHIIEELKRNISETGSAKAYSYLGFALNELGMFNEAIEAYVKVLAHPSGNHVEAYNGIAYAYVNLGDADRSNEYFMKSLFLQEDASTLYKIGVNYLSKGDEKTAMRYLEKALNLNKDLVSIYPMLIGVYRSLGMEDRAIRLSRDYEKSRLAQEGEDHFRAGLTAYFDGKYEIAVNEFLQSLKINPSNPAPYSNLGYVYFDIGLTEMAYDYHKKALDIDPNNANSHYGLALIYKRWGDMAMAKKQWEEYLRIEPEGYYSRRAREEVDALMAY